jgi:hypothetical protein
VTSRLPAGCTGGTPELTQACTYTPPAPTLDGAALYGSSCQRCHGSLASSDLRGLGLTVASIDGDGMRMGRTDAELQAIISALR